MRAFPALLVCGLLGCTTSTPPVPTTPVVPPPHDTLTPPPPIVHHDTLSELRDRPDSIFYYRSPGGKVMRVLQWPHDPEVEAMNDTTRRALTVRSAEICGADDFGGQKRALAKTTNVGGHITVYQSVAALRTALPTDAVMRTKGLTSSSRASRKRSTRCGWWLCSCWP